MGDADLLAAGADWIMNDCASLRISTDSPTGQLVLELPADELRHRPAIR
jgi:hypothetical protein